ncbi:hypothetical protein Sfulv_37240 [Streptomyces fulvorobeus]|uniref:Uncharacterized protein n=1 Tax=Streptomyces fulvorobeus TaxID=284028 RepID=A0A7J0CAK8_9ACTN|nr:hypothetical protein Sfulv_37240 [Streptomyces fulvorobeus]
MSSPEGSEGPADPADFEGSEDPEDSEGSEDPEAPEAPVGPEEEDPEAEEPGEEDWRSRSIIGARSGSGRRKAVRRRRSGM